MARRVAFCRISGRRRLLCYIRVPHYWARKGQYRARDFSIGEFYFRRAKRLLPAAYVTFFVTTILARFMLPSSEASDFGLQLIGAVTYTANIVLWQQTGYFAEPADLKPLLHVWSLAVEEQFYLLLPWLLVFIAPQRWLRVAVVVLIASLALCVSRWADKACRDVLPFCPHAPGSWRLDPLVRSLRQTRAH
jgi:peptidoglycan/LPS O-acetylase OafA/YrhL